MIIYITYRNDKYKHNFEGVMYKFDLLSLFIFAMHWRINMYLTNHFFYTIVVVFVLVPVIRLQQLPSDDVGISRHCEKN